MQLKNISIIKSMRSLLDFYLQSSIHVSFSIVALTAMSYWQNDITFDIALLVFTFSSSIAGYNFIKYAPLMLKQKLDWMSDLPLISLVSFLGVLSSLICTIYLSYKVVLLSIFLGFLVFWYTFPITPQGQNLRHQPLIKLLVIALVWASISVLFPILNERLMNVDLSLLVFDIAERMIWVIALMIPFEIRDIVDDSKSGKSVINHIGINKAKGISVGLLVLFINLKPLFYDQIFAVDIFIYISLFLMLLFTRQNQSPYFSSLWVESLPVFWLIFLIFSSSMDVN